MPFEVSTGYSKGKTGVKKTRSAVADEFAESTAFYKDLDAAQRKVFFGTEKLETGPIGEIFRQRLEAAGITRFTNEDGTVDYEAAIREFKRQWTNYERGGEILKERSDYDEARAKAYVEEMERVEAAEREAMDQISAEEAAARDEAAKSGMMFSRKTVGNQEIAIADDLDAMEKINPRDPRSVERYILDNLEDNIRMLAGGDASITAESAKHYAWSKVRGFDGRQMRQARAKAATVIRDLIEMFTANGRTQEPAKPGKNGIAWRCRLPIAVPRLDSRRNVVGAIGYDADVIIKDEGNGKFFYDVSHLKKNGTLTGKLDKQKNILFGSQGTALPPSQAGSASGVPTGEIITNSSEGAQGGRKLLFSRSGIFTGSVADYANRSRQGGKDDGPSIVHIGKQNGIAFGWGLYGSTSKSDGENFGRHVYEQTFFTNREPGDESHLIEWDKPLSQENKDRILDGLVYKARHNRHLKEAIERNLAQEAADFGLDKSEDYVREEVEYMADDVLRDAIERTVDVSDNGRSVYKHLAALLSGKSIGESNAFANRNETYKRASEFLRNECDIDGIKYPAEADGAKAGETHYVSFRDDNIRVDHKWTDGQLLFSRAVKPSALGDGKQRYYEVPFDKAVDKIVKNRKPVSDEHVFISETPDVFREIGLPSLPVMMNQSHVLSCYFGQGEGVKAGNMHGLGAKLKSLPKAIGKPMMVIANDSNPSSSVIAIVKMQDRDGHTVIAPVEINGIGRSNAGPITANIVKSAFGKKNLWSEKVAKALRDEVDGKVAVFYIDSNEARQISNRLAREAFNFGKSERQLLSVTKGTVHSIADFGSPVKGVGAQKDSRQFKNWFGGSKVVDANGEPLVVYHDTNAKRYINRKTGEDWDLLSPEERAKWESRDDWDEHWEEQDFYAFDDRNSRSTVEFPAHFFTPVPDPYHEYGKRRIAAYLSMRKPAINPEIHNRSEEGAGRREMEQLKAEGYDGIIRTDDDGKVVEYAVFDPSQIKSAADNIGTFDPGNNDIRFSRGTAPEAEYVRLTRVADDAGAGERTPGAMAASAELSRTTPTPLTTKGTRYVALPVSEMAALARYLKIGHAQLLRQDMPGGVSLKHKKLWIAADVLGTVDKTDMAAEKEILKRHGFFQQEDPGWLAAHSPTDARRERFRSEDALAAKLEALADRRIAGKEPGGFAAGRKVFADQLAKVVMSMPHGQPGVLGAMQTVGGALEKRVRGDEAEADAFIGWMKGETTPPARSAQERKAEMFAAFLMMPQQNLSSAESSPAAELTMRSRA